MISKATRKQKQTETLLYNIFVNNLALYHSSGIIVEDLSDHLPVFMTLKVKSERRENRETVTVFDKRKMIDLNAYLVDKLRDFQTNTDANIASHQLLTVYTDGIKLFSKSYKPSRRKSTMKPWISPSILCSINKKTQLYNKFIRRGNQTNEHNYKAYRNILVNIIRDAKRLYFRDELKKTKNDGKATWALLNEVINKKNKKKASFPETFYDDEENIYTKSEIPEGFNEFFSTVGETLDKEIPRVDVDPLQYLSKQEHDSCNSIPKLTNHHVENVIRSLNNVAGGLDKISAEILLGTYKNVLHHLTFFFNLCLNNAIFPDNLKVAVIIPIHKAGNKDKFTNYRPISLLPILSKILEKIIHLTLSEYLEEHSILYPLQFGFRKKHSTYRSHGYQW